MNSMHMHWVNVFNLVFSLGVPTEMCEFGEGSLYSRVLTSKAVELGVNGFW